MTGEVGLLSVLVVVLVVLVVLSISPLDFVVAVAITLVVDPNTSVMGTIPVSS